MPELLHWTLAGASSATRLPKSQNVRAQWITHFGPDWSQHHFTGNLNHISYLGIIQKSRCYLRTITLMISENLECRTKTWQLYELWTDSHTLFVLPPERCDFVDFPRWIGVLNQFFEGRLISHCQGLLFSQCFVHAWTSLCYTWVQSFYDRDM